MESYDALFKRRTTRGSCAVRVDQTVGDFKDWAACETERRRIDPSCARAVRHSFAPFCQRCQSVRRAIALDATGQIPRQSRERWHPAFARS